jgi:hypothetical protein
MDRGGRARHSERGSGAGSDGEGGQVDLAEKEDGLGWRRMVLGDGGVDVVRMVWEQRRGELVSISESVRT